MPKHHTRSNAVSAMHIAERVSKDVYEQTRDLIQAAQVYTETRATATNELCARRPLFQRP